MACCPFRTCRCLAILGVFVAATGTANAQQQSSGSMFGANSPTTGVGGISSTGSMTGSSVGPGAMTSPAFGSAFGGTGAGRGAQTLGSTGQIGAGYNNPAAGLGGQLGQVGGNIVGRNNMQGQIGNALAGQGQRGGQGGLNQLNRGGAQGARGAQGGRNARGGNNRGGNQNFNQQQGMMGGNAQQQQRQIRPQLRVSFDYDKPLAAKMDQALTTRFDALTQRYSKNGNFKNVTVEADSGVVTLRGQVGRDEDKRLAETIAKLEPGVRSVRNELSVGPPAVNASDSQ